jgi:putative tryptophan/tyrosine transport system substrate-binding protein
LTKALNEIAERKHDGLVITVDIMFVRERHRIADLALAKRLPTMAFAKTFTAAGTLMSYGADADDLYRRVGAYIDKILRGAQLRELPVRAANEI